MLFGIVMIGIGEIIVELQLLEMSRAVELWMKVDDPEKWVDWGARWSRGFRCSISRDTIYHGSRLNAQCSNSVHPAMTTTRLGHDGERRPRY